RRAPTETFFEQRFEHSTILHAQWIGAITLVHSKIGPAKGLAEARPKLVARHGDGNFAILTTEIAVWNDGREAGASRYGDHAGAEIVGEARGHGGHERVKHGDVDELARARAMPRFERQQR